MATIAYPARDFMQSMPLHRFSTADYLEMIEKGVFGPDDRVELIDGVIVDMSPQGSRHNHFVTQLNHLLVPLWSTMEIVVQGTLMVAEGRVYDPDLMLLRRKPRGYKLKLPEPSDVLLVVEAADTSLTRDQKIKLPAYVAAGIPEYWIADLERELLLVHREPEGGNYKLVESKQGDDLISPAAAPQLSFAVRQAFE